MRYTLEELKKLDKMYEISFDIHPHKKVPNRLVLDGNQQMQTVGVSTINAYKKWKNEAKNKHPKKESFTNSLTS